MTGDGDPILACGGMASRMWDKIQMMAWEQKRGEPVSKCVGSGYSHRR
jgi:hypothetical protein